MSDQTPPHKADLLVKVQDVTSDEVYITGGWYDGDTNSFDLYGFNEEIGYYPFAWAVVPGQWEERDELPELSPLQTAAAQIPEETRTRIREYTDGRDLIHVMATALRDLHDAQNGPPLERDRDEWAAVMARVIEVLERVGY